jgi:hypothetical protein
MKTEVAQVRFLKLDYLLTLVFLRKRTWELFYYTKEYPAQYLFRNSNRRQKPMYFAKR